MDLSYAGLRCNRSLNGDAPAFEAEVGGQNDRRTAYRNRRRGAAAAAESPDTPRPRR